jgi:hypothetical protein
VVKFLDACIGHPALATIRGDMWQPYANHIMRQSPLLWRQKIDPASNARVGAAVQHQFQVSAIAARPIQWVGDFQQLAAQQYGIPMPANWPTLDAVLEPNITLQWTVSAKHSVNEGGLHDACQQLQQKATALAGSAAAVAAGVTAAAATTIGAAAAGAVTAGAAPAAIAAAATAAAATAAAVPAGSAAVGAAAAGAAIAAAASFQLEHHFGVPREQFNKYSLTLADFIAVAGKACPANVDYYVLLVEDPSAAKKRKVSNQPTSQPVSHP